jgi:hypothetical protein
MNYTITPSGIVYSFPTEEGHEERRTDDIADVKPLTQAEIIAKIHEVAEQMEQWQDALPIQPLADQGR